MSIANLIGLLGAALLGAAVTWWFSRSKIEYERRASEEKLALVQRSQDEWETRLRALTSEALEKSSTSLLDRAEERLRPIRETLTRFDEQTKELEHKRVEAVTAIGEELKRVAEGQEKLRLETGNLVTALRRPDVRGRWGEMQLKRVVELAGMLEYCDFDTQESSRDDEGRLLRPDLIVRLPGGKSIVVDSKAPFDAYADAIGADDVDVKRRHLVRHAAQVRDHIAKLGAKQYWKQFKQAPEFVVMFIDEGLYRAALDQDASLFETSVEAGVIVASPATLIALLRTVAYGWQQETITASARQIAQEGRALYERIGVFAGTFSSIGRSLDKAVRDYNSAVASLDTRLLVTARKFPALGAGSGDLPEVEPIDRVTRTIAAPELEFEGGQVELLPSPDEPGQGTGNAQHPEHV
ncbi:MAG: DNA recombination protein RmuC [Actinomycetes bacterium]